jgi:hypothetical protein
MDGNFSTVDELVRKRSDEKDQHNEVIFVTIATKQKVWLLDFWFVHSAE